MTRDKEWLNDIDCFIMADDFRLECIPRSAACVALKDVEYVVVATNAEAVTLL